MPNNTTRPNTYKNKKMNFDFENDNFGLKKSGVWRRKPRCGTLIGYPYKPTSVAYQSLLEDDLYRGDLINSLRMFYSH